MTDWCDLETDAIELLDNVEVDASIVDNGIGSYEYWGQRGYDSRPGVESDSSGEFSMVVVVDLEDDGLDINFGDLPDDEMEAEVLALIDTVGTSRTFGGCGYEPDEDDMRRGRRGGHRCGDQCREFDVDLTARPVSVSVEMQPAETNEDNDKVILTIDWQWSVG